MKTDAVQQLKDIIASSFHAEQVPNLAQGDDYRRRGYEGRHHGMGKKVGEKPES
jgi:hypothetical protein